ncbi:MAG: hydrolase [Clostridia bacterium]|nr:hydrolase [Clostridia bacterium]
MAGQKFEAKDKTVHKISKDGLVEENLHDGTRENISHRERDAPHIKSAEYTIDRQERLGDKKTEPDKKNKIYRDKVSTENASEPPARAAPFHESRKKQGTLPEQAEKKQVTEDVEEFTEDVPLQHQSLRMDSVRGAPAGKGIAYAEGVLDARHSRKKKMVQDYARKQEAKAEKVKAESEAGSHESKVYENPVSHNEKDLSDFKEEIDKKSKRERAKKASRLAFDDEGSMLQGAGIGLGKKAAVGAAIAASAVLHGKMHEGEEDNAAVEGAHRSELLAEAATRSLRKAQNRRKKTASYSSRFSEQEAWGEGRSRLRFGSGVDAEKMSGKAAAQDAEAKRSMVKRFWQKMRYKEAYAAAKQGKKSSDTIRVTQTFAVKAKKVAQEIFKRNRSLLVGLGIFALIFLLAGTSLISCSAMFQGAGSSVIGTTYASTDDDIYAVENAYLALETALNNQINNMESTHPGYDEYQYQIAEISHNPYHLISYFTAKYGEFTYEQVADEVEEIFREQYSLATEGVNEMVTETRTVRVGESLGQVVTSGYCNCTICCGQWSGGPTASGVYPTANHTIAVDASNPFVPMGTKVVMNGVEYVVEDTGAFDQFGVQFDVYYGDHATASAHGHQTWEAYIADSNGSQEVEVTSTSYVNRLNVTLTNRGLDGVLRSRMDANEEKRYDLYNTTYGNRDYLFDINNLPFAGNGDGFGYDIPADALTDERFANMIGEAEKYLGYPYVWGGASPSTSFDCSGFVSWVINNCGNGWNIGRQTADGLRGSCAYVSPSEAKPGDLIFFQGTYDTPGASHVGIYVGDGMMIHCGNPIQYASINTPYWQQHFMAFGRLP